MGRLGSKDYHPPWIVCLSLPMLPALLTCFPQIRAKRHPEASIYLQVQLVRLTVNTTAHFASTPFRLDAFIVLP